MIQLKTGPLSAIRSPMLNLAKFRSRFIRDLLLVSFVLSGAVIAAVVFFSLRAREDISQTYIDNATANAVR
jgi:hypothetical protein